MFSFKKSEPKIVPEKLQEKINYKIFILILGGVLFYQFYLYSFPNPDDPLIGRTETIVTTATAALAAFFGFLVAHRYWKSKVFGWSYLALALGMLMNALAERIYDYYDQTGQTASPSLADVVWLAFYPLMLYHLASNIRFFKPKIRLPVKVFVIILPIAITGIYAVLEFNHAKGANTEFYLGLAYIVGSSVILSGAILGAMIFRQGLLGTPWLILALGIVLTTVGDNWYSYTDVYDQYTLTHPLNLLWYAGYLVIAYALYKHRKVI